MKKFVFVSVFVLFGCLNAFCVGVEIGASFDISNYRYTVTAIIDGTQTEVSIAAVPGKKAEITEIDIPSQVTWTHTNELGESVETPCIVTSVAETGFKACPNVQSITIPGSVKSIGKEAFRDITSTFTVHFNEGLETIDAKAFCRSYGLQDSLIFPSTLKTLGGNSFGGCQKVSYVEFLSEEPVSMSTYLDAANNDFFKEPKDISQGFIVDVMYVPDGAKWRAKLSYTPSTMTDTNKGDNLIPTLPFYPFASKGTEIVVDNILYDVYDLNGNNKTDTCARIAGVIFAHPDTIIFPETVTIGGAERKVTYAKASCFGGYWGTSISGIKYIRFPSTLRSIGREAFRSIDSKFTIDLNEGLETIGNRAFCRSTGLLGTRARCEQGDSSLVIPSTVTRMEEYCLCQCFSINDSIVMLPDSAPTVPDGQGFLFAETPAVVRIPCGSINKYHPQDTTLNYWSTRTLYDACDHDIIMGPTFLYRIIDHDKKYLSLLGRHKVGPADVVIPDSVEKETGKGNWYYVKKIAENAFNKSNQLTSLTIPVCIDSIEPNAFYENTSLKTLKIASKLIKEKAFYQCSALETLILNSGVKYIAKNAFSNCTKVKHITFPATLDSIADYAFNGSKAIKEVEFLGTVPPKLCGDNILSTGSGTTLERIWVPCGLYETYSTTDNGPGRWIKLQSYLRSRCPALEWKKDETVITKDTTVSTIALRRTFNVGEWTPLYFPFEVDSVLVVNNNAKRISINQPWTIEKGGYFYLETLKGIDTEHSTLSFELADAIQAQTPYLVQFTTDYFNGKDVIFKSKEGEYTLETSPKGDLTRTTEYTIKGNEGYVNETVPLGYFLNYNQNNNIYHLYLKENSSLSPFDFVLLPPKEETGNTTTSKLPRRFSMRTSSTGNISGDDITTSFTSVSDTEPVRYTRDGEQVTLYPAGKALKVYSIDGMLLYSVEAGTDIVTMNLSAGMYILYCNGNSQKMLL